MNKTTNKGEFLDYAYSPVNIEHNQRIINPKKKKITFSGIRYLKENNNIEIKIHRKKS
jgi:hypothetical protein